MSTFMDHIHRASSEGEILAAAEALANMQHDNPSESDFQRAEDEVRLLAGPKVGDRVEVPAYTDDWMRGDRFGTVTHVKEAGNFDSVPDSWVRWVRVHLHKSGCVHYYRANDCKVVTS